MHLTILQALRVVYIRISNVHQHFFFVFEVQVYLKYSVICLFASLHDFTSSLIPHQDEALQSDLDGREGNIYTREKLRQIEEDQMGRAMCFPSFWYFRIFCFPVQPLNAPHKYCNFCLCPRVLFCSLTVLSKRCISPCELFPCETFPGAVKNPFESYLQRS